MCHSSIAVRWFLSLHTDSAWRIQCWGAKLSAVAKRFVATVKHYPLIHYSPRFYKLFRQVLRGQLSAILNLLPPPTFTAACQAHAGVPQGTASVTRVPCDGRGIKRITGLKGAK